MSMLLSNMSFTVIFYLTLPNLTYVYKLLKSFWLSGVGLGSLDSENNITSSLD